jgi:hypothetical protein
LKNNPDLVKKIFVTFQGKINGGAGLKNLEVARKMVQSPTDSANGVALANTLTTHRPMGWLSKKTAGREPAWTPEYFKRYIKIKYPDAVYVNDAAARNARAAGKYTTFPGANAKLIKSKWFTNFGTNTVRDQGQPRNDLAFANAKSRANAYLRTENPDVKKFKNNMNRITNASNIRLKNVKWHLLSRPIATPVNRKAEAKLVTLRSGKTALNEVANTAAAAAAAGVNRAWVDLKVAQQNASNTSKSTQLTPYQRRLIEMIANGNFANIYGNNEPKKRVALTKLLGGGTVDGSPAATADAIKAAMNAVLLTGDYKYLDLPRSQFDLIWSLRKEIDGLVKVPHRHFDAGWADYRLPSARHMIYIWTTSMAQEDLDRILALPRDNNWDAIYIPGVSGGDKATGRDTKHYIANTLPWFQFVQGHLPNYPVEILQANLELIKIQLRKMRSNTGNPRNWDSYDPATADEVVGLDLRVPGYNIHAWQEFNPVYFEGLGQMVFGGPMHISHGGLQHGKVRFFDGKLKRPGLPPDVAVIVDGMDATTLSMQVANIGGAAQELYIQAGTFGEHRFESVEITGADGTLQDIEIGSKWFALDLVGGAVASLKFKISRYVNDPSYETPWSSRSEWDPIIKGRNL